MNYNNEMWDGNKNLLKELGFSLNKRQLESGLFTFVTVSLAHKELDDGVCNEIWMNILLKFNILDTVKIQICDIVK